MDDKKNIKVDSRRVKLVIWDWYKTLSDSHLYSDLDNTNPGAYELIQNYFVENKDTISEWMQGKVTYREMHKEFSKITGISVDVFDKSLTELAGKFDIDPSILPYVKKIKELGINQVIATDNFDVWDEFFLPQYSQYLSEYFVNSYNSSKFRILKSKQAIEFINRILVSQKVSAPDTLLIDDNTEFCQEFISQGGQAINHSDISNLAERLKQAF